MINLVIGVDKNQTLISNKSKFTIFLSLIPIKPKRKTFLIYVIEPNCFKIFDEVIDITKYYIRFEDKNEKGHIRI